jgi:tRNA(Ile)-lysidine synthetase-like protein
MWANPLLKPDLLQNAVRRFLERRQLAGQGLVVGVSGGPDSLALLRALVELQQTNELRLHVAHFDHQLRADSRADATFVREVGESYRLGVTIATGDVARQASSHHLGIEEAGRAARYAFFRSVVEATSSVGVAVGHTRDDQCETRLLHLVRGSGLRGLKGMADDALLPLDDGGTVRVLRPLLTVSHANVESYCAWRGLRPRLDPSNQSRAFDRNRLRHDVLPVLRELNPRIDASLERLARIAADADQYLDDELDRRLPDLVRLEADAWVIDRDHWRGLPVALRRQTLRRATAAVGDDVDVGADAVERALELADGHSSGAEWHLPGGLILKVTFKTVTVARAGVTATRPEERAVSLLAASDSALWALPRSLDYGPTGGASARLAPSLRVRQADSICPNRRGDHWHADLDRATLGAISRAVVRTRRAGDWMAPEGMSGRKKLQDLFVDQHLPRADRDRVPILEVDGTIVWVMGLRRDRRFLAGEQSRDVICVEVLAHPGGGT